MRLVCKNPYVVITKSGVALYVFLRKPQKATYLLLRTAARLSSFFQKAKRLAFKAVLRCMGCDLSVVVPVDEMINIKDDYEAVHGAVTDAASKVFLKYFFVNTKTGENSGEMMAAVKLG